MSSYNLLVMPEEDTCPNFGSRIVRKVQFKYAEVWQHEYQIGDKISWGTNNVGSPGRRRVLLSAHPEPCPVCGNVPNVRYEVLVENDVLIGVERASVDTEHKRFDHEHFVVLES
ncbi:MAG TPA: hypothetical protein VFD88_00310 [Clostridia bacterium]|nr:hypothetical protein [Clostridia bacterium]